VLGLDRIVVRTDAGAERHRPDTASARGAPVRYGTGTIGGGGHVPSPAGRVDGGSVLGQRGHIASTASLP
jgi:hypothetical protein